MRLRGIHYSMRLSTKCKQSNKSLSCLHFQTKTKIFRIPSTRIPFYYYYLLCGTHVYAVQKRASVINHTISGNSCSNDDGRKRWRHLWNMMWPVIGNFAFISAILNSIGCHFHLRLSPTTHSGFSLLWLLNYSHFNLCPHYKKII